MGIRFDQNFFHMMRQFAKESAEALSKDRQWISKTIRNILQREVEKEIKGEFKTEDGKPVKKTEMVPNTLDNILPSVYDLGTRSTGLRNIPRYYFHIMLEVEEFLRTIERLRTKIKTKVKQGDAEDPYLKAIKEVLGRNARLVSPDVYLNYPKEVFTNFLSKAIQPILLEIVPNIAKDVSIPVVFGDHPESRDPFNEMDKDDDEDIKELK